MDNSETGRVPAWQKALAWLAFGAGLLLGVTALFAALGVWFGWWDFRRGFFLLRIVNVSALWVAIAALIIATVVFALSRRVGGGAAALALVGALAAGLAWYVPQTYRPAEGTPPIHDISTDTRNPPDFVAVLPLREEAPNSAVYGDSPNLNAKKLAQLQQEAYPDIQTRRIEAPKEAVFTRALRAVDHLGWELVDKDLEEGRIEATDTTFWFRFKDDVVIRMREENGQTLVDVRSVSRVGVSDVGKNAARIREFFATL